MHRDRRSLVFLVLILASAGCARNPAPEAGPRAAAEPRLIACGEYTPPVFHWTTENRMWIQVAVRPDGTVRPGSAHYVPSRFDRGGADAVARAKEMAESCVFSPVQVDGEPVEAMARVRIAFGG